MKKVRNMKKRVALMIALAMSAATFAGCGLNHGGKDNSGNNGILNPKDNSHPDKNGNSSDTDYSNGTTENITDGDVLNYEEIYQDKLDMIHRILLHPETAELDSDIDEGIMGVLEIANYSENPLAEAGYAFVDLSGDGFCELVIGVTSTEVLSEEKPGNQILSAYTINEGETVCAFSGSYRNAYYLMNDGQILFSASNSAFSSGFGISSLNPEGTMLTCNKLIYTGIGPDGENAAVFESDGVWDENDNYLTDMSLDEYDRGWQNYAADTKYIDLIPFEFYDHPDGYVGVEGVYPVYVGYADDAAINSCEQWILDDGEYSTWISLYANCDVESLLVMELSNVEYLDDGTFNYNSKQEFEVPNFTQGTELVVKMDLPETLPFYAISYYEKDGTYHIYAIIVSGEDGSVGLMEIN